MKKRLNREEFIIRARVVHGMKYDYSKIDKIEDKIIIVCPIHGEFLQSYIGHLRGRGCNKCRFDKLHDGAKLNTNEFINRSKQIHGDKYNYSKVNYIGSVNNVIIICPIHGEFIQKANSHLRGQGCRNCRNEYYKQLYTSNTQRFIESAKLIHADKYDYSKTIYTVAKNKVIITCSKHGDFIQKASTHLEKSGCPECGMNIFISNGEKEFLNYIGISKSQKNFGKDRVDGFKDGVIYEYLGDYWHGNPSSMDHNKICRNKKIPKTFGELYKDTFDRFNRLSKLTGYIIKYIWENDWLKFRKGIDKIPNIQEYHGD